MRRFGPMLLAVILLASPAACGKWAGGTPHSEAPAAIRQQLDATVATAVERTDQFVSCLPGTAPTCAVTCTATVFGMDPRRRLRP